jgi:tRNA threonylcarbamoyladenosine biosynthesis protein TsaB
MMAGGLLAEVQDKDALYCPMIDARRQEVFTAIYDGELNEVLPPQALILTPEVFDTQLAENKVYFFGDGSFKWELMLSSRKNAIFAKYVISAAQMAELSAKYYTGKQFVDVAYFSPFYLKPFYTPQKS